MLNGKTALITGTNRGIGRALLETFAANGANVIAHARKETPEFIRLTENISAQNNVTITPVYFEMTDSDAIRTALKPFVLGHSPIDVLINNAGIGHGVSFLRTPITKIKEVFEVNLFSHMEITQLVLRKMCRQKSGSIINFASVSGIDLPAGNSAYGTSKAAMAAWTKTLAAELGSFNIRVNAIAPGLIETEMGASVKDFIEERMIASSALKRKGKPSEIADIAVFLASDLSSFVNGTVIRADGGQA